MVTDIYIYIYINTQVYRYKKYKYIQVNLDVIFSTVIQSYPVVLEVFSLHLWCKT